MIHITPDHFTPDHTKTKHNTLQSVLRTYINLVFAELSREAVLAETFKPVWNLNTLSIILA